MSQLVLDKLLRRIRPEVVKLVVTVDAIDQERLTIQEQLPALRLDRPDAEAAVQSVDHIAVSFERCDQGIQDGRFG